jgi:hypothetical protein
MLPIKFVDLPAVVADPADVAKGTVQLDSVAFDKVPPEIATLEIVPPLMTGAVKVLFVMVWTPSRVI